MECKKNNLKIYKAHYFLIFILLIQIFYLTISFGINKQGFHSDEIFEYGFSNSYYSKDIYKDDLGNSFARQWHSSKDLLNYISVEDIHKFSFNKPYLHARMDYNPPFHLFLLHFICSFFPGVFSKWFAFSINLFCFIITQICLFCLIHLITRDLLPSFACVVLFGFNAGCLNSISFLRMYELGMALGVSFLLFSFKILLMKYKNIYFNLFLCFLLLFLGAFTLHLFLVLAFPIVFSICCILLIKKRIKHMFLYGFSCAISVVLSYLLFPKLVVDTMQSADTYSYTISKYSDALQFRMYLYLLTLDNFGIHFSQYSNPGFKISIVIILFLFVLILPIVFLFRKSNKFLIFLRDLKKHIISFLKNKFNVFLALIILVLTSLFLVFLCSKRTSIYIMSLKYSSRYIFIIYPIACSILVLLLYLAISLLVKNRIYLFVVLFSYCIVLAIWSQMLSEHSFMLKEYKSGMTIDNLENNANCIVVLGQDWLITNYAPTLYHTNSYYFVDYENFNSNNNLLEGINNKEPLYLIIDRSRMLTDEDVNRIEENKVSDFSKKMAEDAYYLDDFIGYFSSLPKVKSVSKVGVDTVYERENFIYKIDLY